jgi:hypothetical protein
LSIVESHRRKEGEEETMATNTVALSRRAFSDEEMDTLRALCDTHKLGYGIFCSVIVSDVLLSEELTQKYLRKAQQFEEDQRPATVAEMKTLREQLRQQEEELAQLRAFKETQLSVLSGSR